MYTAPKLIELLEQQQQKRGRSDLFKQGKLTIQWRAKVGSSLSPDLETMISAAEPYGAWRPQAGCPTNLSRPEDKRNVGDNWNYFRELPLVGYLPASGIRGLVRSWVLAQKDLELQRKMEELLGVQQNDTITTGKIAFLDAYPAEPTKVTLDIVNPQESFQVFHQGQSTPLSFYTLGNGAEKISLTVAIKGIRDRATPEDVETVWNWLQQALSLYGVGSRTASGYGSLKPATKISTQLEPGYKKKTFDFTLYTQGCAGADMKTMELRPSHWRGWLRSWVLRFLLGVMSKDDAQKTVGELFGTIEPEAVQGCVRLRMIQGKTWGEKSDKQPIFYTSKGKLEISAPRDILNKIILPIVKFAVTVGGVGRGWRRPLHIFKMNNGQAAARGTHLRPLVTS
jgi:CRISPR-associated protein Cmr6